MSPLTIEKATNTEDTDEHFEIKKLSEQNIKLKVALEAEREQFRFFLNGILRNLKVQNEGFAKSLDLFNINLIEHEELNFKTEIFKSINIRMPDGRDVTPNIGQLERVAATPREVGAFAQTNIFERPRNQILENKRIAQIRPNPRNLCARENHDCYLKR